jgi:transcription elongation factor GreB
MNKAFVKEQSEHDDDINDELSANELLRLAPGERPPPLTKNYMTPEGYTRMRQELLRLLDVDRPEMVQIVSWAASNGDRSENGDYLYGKKRLREIDRRIRFLTKRLDIAEVVDSALQKAQGCEQVFFGATVSFLRNDSQVEETITIVGIDEVEPLHILGTDACNKVSWISPIAKALIKAREGDVIQLRTPAGVDDLEITSVVY